MEITLAKGIGKRCWANNKKYLSTICVDSFIFYPTTYSDVEGCADSALHEGACWGYRAWAKIQPRAPLTGLPFSRRHSVFNFVHIWMVSVYGILGWVSISPSKLLNSLYWSKNTRSKSMTWIIWIPRARSVLTTCLATFAHILRDDWSWEILRWLVLGNSPLFSFSSLHFST